MDVHCTIELSSDDERELADILGCAPEELADELSSYATAALREHVAMFLGQRVFTRGSDLLEYRLLLLIEYAFEGRVPEVQEVCNLFQLTSSSGRSLIRAVMSKYQYQLKDAIAATMSSLLDSAEVDDQRSCVTLAVHNTNFVEELNAELADIDTSMAPVQRRRGSVSTYELQPASYLCLCERFAVEPKIKRRG